MSALRVAIYARVSTTDQTCELQLKELREYCKRRAWGVPAEYVDTGWSGAKASRPELNRLMREARQRKVDCIIVWKLDRWGRSLINCLESVQELSALQVRWIAVTENFDTDSSNPMSRLLLTLMAAFAQYERELIGERVRAGLKSYRQDFSKGVVGKDRHSRSGRDLPVGGQRRVFSHRKVFQLRKAGRSLREIAATLKIGKGTVERLLKASHGPA